MRKKLFLLSLLLLQVSAFAAGHGAEEKGISGLDAYSALEAGNTRFYEGTAKHPKQDPLYRESLATGQHPHSIVISCSDSRVPPETVFDQGLGEIFSIRLAGHVLNADAIASIEYAIAHLGPKFLVVMGHESCGAVAAAINTKKGQSAGSPSLDELVGKIRPNIESTLKGLSSAEKLYRAPVKAQVSATLKDLFKRSAIVRAAVEKEELVMAQAIYSLKSGRVEFWDVGGIPSGIPGTASALSQEVVHSENIKDTNIKPAVAPAVKTPSQKSPADPHSHP